MRTILIIWLCFVMYFLVDALQTLQKRVAKIENKIWEKK